MEQTTTPNIVGVRFTKVGKVYHFDANKYDKLQFGDVVIVETSRGMQIGEVVGKVANPVPPPDGTWKLIERLATPRDLLQRQSWQEKEPDVVTAAHTRAKELRLANMKIISAEYSYDGSRLTIFFSTDSEEKVELKSLRSDMQRAFQPAQVDIRQIGPRDVAKFMGGMGACGLETRCCAMFITEFSSISIRMAKEQGISLAPAEITGMCGRLRCCLIYEYQTYVEARSHLPKRNKRVITPNGEGKVIDLQPLRDVVVVDLPEIGRKEFHISEIKPAEEYEAIAHKAENPGCAGGTGGGGGACAFCKQRQP
jgi:cell fate regulator YaaT (PSP1 superfamily)